MSLLQTVAITKIMNDHDVLSIDDEGDDVLVDAIILDLGGGRTVRVYDSGTICWYQNEQCHREDGPAVEWDNGNSWYLNSICMSQQDHAKAMALLQKERAA